MAKDNGWVKLWRKSIDTGLIKNHKVWIFWTYCLMKANHEKNYKVVVGFTEEVLQPGQFIFGRKVAAKETGLSEQSIRTCLAFLKKCQNLTIKSTNKYSVISIVNWERYQSKKSKSTNNPTNDQPASNHIQEHKNIRIKDIVEYLNLKTGKNYKPSTEKTRSVIKARINEKFKLEDFKKVIDIKTAEWLHDPKNNKFLRPETLFGNKFEGYLNDQGQISNKPKYWKAM